MADSTTTSAVAAQLKALRSELAAADEETKGLELSVRRLAVAEETTAEQLKYAKQALAQVRVANDERKQSIQQQIKALEDQKRAEEDTANASKGRMGALSLALRALSGGSGEVVERFNKVREGFQLAGDKSQSASTRVAAFGSSLALAGETAMGMASQVSAAVERTIGAVQAADEAALAMSRMSDQARAVGPAMAAVSEATHGAVTAQDALALRSSLVEHGLDTSSRTMAAAAVRIREFAQLNGVTAAQAVGTFMQAISSGDQGALARFGLSTVNAATAQERLEQAVQQTSTATAGALTETERLEARQRAQTQAQQEAAQTYVSIFPGLRFGRILYNQYLDSVAAGQRVQEATAGATRNEEAARRDAEAATAAHARAMGELARQSAAASQALKQATTDTANFAAEAREGETTAQHLARRMSGLRGLVRNQLLEQQENRGLLAQLRAEGASARELAVARQRLGIQDTGPQAAAAAKEADRQREEALRRALDLELHIATVARNRGESEVHYHERVAAYVQRTIAAYQDEMRLLDRGLNPAVNSVARNAAFNDNLRALSGSAELSAEQQATLGQGLLDRRRARARQDEEGALRRRFRGFEREAQDSPQTMNLAARLQEFRAEQDSLERQLTEAERRSAAPGASEADVAATEGLRRRMELLGENISRVRELSEVQRENNDLSLQMGRSASQAFGLQTSSAQRFAQASTSALQAVGSAIESHIIAMAQGKESAGQALEGMATDIAAYVAKVGLERGAEEAVAAIASAAAYDYNGAALHGAAAAGYFALAGAGLGVSAGLAAAHGGGQTAPGLAGPASSQASSGGGSRAEGGGGAINLTVVYQGGRPLATRRQLAHEHRALADEAARALDRRRAA